MTYNNIQSGIFINRPNRFIANVQINQTTEICHVKNTGRCRELLVPGATVYVSYVNNPSRSTQYDLVAVEKNGILINMDSYAPNLAFGEYLRSGNFSEVGETNYVKSEAKYGNSRFDFYAETATKKAFIEVKGVTLEENSIAMFPDAPTERGVKHLNELAACITEGYNAYGVFIIQMKGIKHFTPNYKIHEAFGKTLQTVANMGVKIMAFDCVVTPDTMTVDKLVQIIL